MGPSIRVLSFIFLLLGVVAATEDEETTVEGETCPDAEKISPCHCTEYEFTGDLIIDCYDDELLNNLTSLKQAMNGLSDKKKIDLRLNQLNLGTVPSDYFKGFDIIRLNLGYCRLRSLSDDGRPILLGLEDRLQELVFGATLEADFAQGKLQLEHMRNLTELDINTNFITEMGDDWFEKGPFTLEYLKIVNNGIEKIGSRVFANLINLKLISLGGNRFGPIQRSMLPSTAESLEELELDDNAFTSLPEDIFTGMPSLVRVSLVRNGILRLEERIWSQAWAHLAFLGLEGNPVECDSNMDWLLNFENVPTIYGQCHAPSEVKDKEIQDFIKSKRPEE